MIKKILTAALVFTAAPALQAQKSTTNETKTILRAIDNICGDTWCEGAYGFRFQKVLLNKNTNSTEVLFTMSIEDPIELLPSASIRKQQYDVACKVEGFSTFAGIMKTEDSLNWDFYMSLTDCIQTLEARLSKILRKD